LEDNIKRLGLLLIILLTSLLLAACSAFEPEFNDEEIYTDVVYSGDGKSVTIYLDRQVPVSAASQRALTKKLAILGHDFFEVTFMYKTADPNPIIARGSWELGEPAGVNDVYRTDGGINYGAAINASLSNNTGTAIIFAGKKTDKTLLAVGALIGVDGTTSKEITSTTKSVSFALNALKAGAHLSTDESSILTNAASTSGDGLMTASRTVTRNTVIKYRSFPTYMIPTGRTTNARYTMDVAANVSGYTPPAPSNPDADPAPTVAGNHFDYYRPGIIYAPNPPAWTGTGDQAGKSVPVYYYYREASLPYNFYNLFNIEPHFTETDGTVQTANLPLVWYHLTDPNGGVIDFHNNYKSTMTVGTSFVNPILFTLDPGSAPDNRIFSFAFQIPVYALSTAGNPVTWFIKHGYDKYFEELDDGKGLIEGGNGGAMLVGIGNITANDATYLNIKKVPKINYNPGNPDSATGYLFSLDGMELQFFNQGTPSQITLPNANVTFTVSLDGGLTYTETISPGQSLVAPPFSAVPPNKQYFVRVRYFPPPFNPLIYYDDFYSINVTDTNIDPGTLLENNRVVVASNNSWTQFSNMVQNSSPPGRGTYLVVFATSFNIPETTINVTGDLILVITANTPGITVGRTATGTNPTIIFNGNGNVTVFIGTWPSDVPVMAGGDVLTDYPFRVNANGTYQAYPGGAITTGKMFVKGTLSGNLDVSTGPDIRVSDNAGVDNFANLR